MRRPLDLHGGRWPDGDPVAVGTWAQRLAGLAESLESAASVGSAEPTWTGLAHDRAVDASSGRKERLHVEAHHIRTVAGLAADLSARLAFAQGETRSSCLRLDGMSEEVDRLRVMLGSAAAFEDESLLGRLEQADAGYGAARGRHVARCEQLVSMVDAADRATSEEMRRSRLERIHTRSLEQLEAHVAGPLTDRLRALTWSAARRPAVGTLLELVRTQKRVRLFRRWLDERRSMLELEPHGDGRLVDVTGDLAAAQSVVVLVPGVGNSLDTHESRLRPAMLAVAAGADDIAVIGWLGYDAPGSLPFGAGPLDPTALGRARADTGAEGLARFLEELEDRIAPHARVTLVGHSYGSLVAALAARTAPVENLVLLGSPGVPVDRNAVQAEQVWASTAPSDPIDELAAFGVPVGSVDDDCQASVLHHGWNPVHDEYGAVEVDLGGHGHSGYFDDLPAAAIAAIAVGRHETVTRVGSGGCDERQR